MRNTQFTKSPPNSNNFSTEHPPSEKKELTYADPSNSLQHF